MRRIHGSAFNLQELKYLNNLSRKICRTLPDMDEVKKDLKEIHSLPTYSNRQGMLIYALISSAFTLFFGGSLLDAAISAVIGVMIKIVEIPLKNMNMNRFLVSCLCSLAAGALAVMAARTGIGCSSDKISIGNVMILIPGLMFTNCIREMISDNFLSGLTRFGESGPAKPFDCPGLCSGQLAVNLRGDENERIKSDHSSIFRCPRFCFFIQSAWERDILYFIRRMSCMVRVSFGRMDHPTVWKQYFAAALFLGI